MRPSRRPRPRSRHGARRRSAGGPRSCSASATWSRSTAREIAALLTARARQGAERRAGRGGARPREPRVRDRHPAPAQGRLQRAGQHRASTSTRSASRSASWPASRRSTSRPWCRCGCSRNAIACGNTFILKPSEKDPSASVYLAELLKEAGVPDGVFNVVHGDKVAVDRDPRAPRHRGGLVRRLDARSPATSTRPARRTGSASRRWAVPRTTWSSCPTPTSSMAADAAVSAAYGSAGERCMAISVVVAVGDVADPLVDAIERAAAEDQGRAGQRCRPRRWAR